MMSLNELKEGVLALPTLDRHEFLVWLNRLEGNYRELPGEALDHLVADIATADDHSSSPTRPPQ